MKALLIMAAVCAFALLRPNFGRAFLDGMQRRLAALADRPWMVTAIAVAVLLFSMALTAFYRLPQPRIHDEFSYLLQSDTFAHGRLANPTHPLWRYFETFHVLQKPTYAAKYPPGQGLFLATGQLIWNPILGVWISTAVAIAALFWTLRAVFEPGFALAGAVLTLFNADVLWWNWSFWGGSVSLIGGSLVLGAMFRNLKTVSAKTNVIMGIGCGLLAITRPFEGLILCSLAVLACFVFCKERRPRYLLSQMVAPLICGVLPFIAFDAYYNYRVTGSPLTLPYVLYEKQYSRSPIFVWQRTQSTKQPTHRHEIDAYFAEEKNNALIQQTPKGYLVTFYAKLKAYDRYFWHGLILLLWIPAMLQWRDRTVRLSFVIFVVTFLASCGLTFWAFPHYTALVFPLVIVLAIHGLRALYNQNRTRLLATLAFVCLCALGFVMFSWRLWVNQKTQWQYNRAELVAKLSDAGSKNLVLVRYSPKHNRHYEWIYNRADIDHAHVVFAPDGDAEYLKPLLTYFKGYEVTHIDPDKPMWGN